jgi:hydroxyethylthiazole kinase-like uncharacterized protein yjeF
MREFKEEELKKLFRPERKSTKEDNGQVTIIGGSSLFHGAPILALKTASRIVDMVFFASPEPSLGPVAEKLKSKQASFIWVPFEEVSDYITKSEAILIGPGLMRFRKESQSGECRDKRICCQEGVKTKTITEDFLKKIPDKQWVIDGGSLQVINGEHIPRNAILTPNKREFALLFGQKKPEVVAKKYHCVVVLKLVETVVCSPEACMVVKGGNAGLTKGGTGDVLAGLTVALAAKNPPFFAARAASYLVKKAADDLYKKVGFAFNADDLVEEIPKVLGKHFR